MVKIMEKVKDFFRGKFVYKPKKKPTEPQGGEKPKPEEKPEDKK